MAISEMVVSEKYKKLQTSHSTLQTFCVSLQKFKQHYHVEKRHIDI